MKIETLRSKDLRRYSILPIKAVQDPAINRTAALAVLAVICSYTDELGRTFVSQARIASDLGITRQAANRQVKRLLELGYLVYARHQYKGQKTNTVKVIYDEDIKTEDDARSALTVKQQIELAERELGLVDNVVHKDVDIKWTSDDQDNQVQHLGLQAGATSEVDRRATSRVALNESLTSNSNGIKGEAKRLCVMFSRAADAIGTPRTFQDRDVQVMEAWVRQGLDGETWQQILAGHTSWCKQTGKDMARGIGYFEQPVKKALGRSRDPAINAAIKGLVGSMTSGARR